MKFKIIVGSGKVVIEGSSDLLQFGKDGSCKIIPDQYGRVDVYYEEKDGIQIFASDLSLLSVGEEKKRELNPVSLAHVFSVYGYRPPKRHTLYQGIRRLGVGEWVEISDGKALIKREVFKGREVKNYGETELKEYAEILMSVVEREGSKEGNVISLSSGWDSTALLACLVKIFGPKKVRAVTGRMQYASRSGVVNQFEIDRAKAVADYYKVRMDIVELDYRHEIPKSCHELQPLLKAHQMPGLTALNLGLFADFVAKTSTGEEVVFAGEISDGAHNLGFSQFTTIFHPVLEFREYSDKMASYLFGPTFLGLMESGTYSQDPIYQLLQGRQQNAIFDPLADDLVSRRRQLLASFFLRSCRLPLWSLQNNKILTEEGRRAYSKEMEEVYLEGAANTLTKETLYSWYLHLYNSFHWQGATVLPFQVLADYKGFKMAMPFWDHRLQEFLSCMPESWGRGLDLNPTKYPLKWMLKNCIDYPLHLQVGPHSYLYDVDPTFNHSAEILYASAFKPHLQELLKRKNYQSLFDSRYFDLDYVETMVRRYSEGTEVRGQEMNDLMTLSFLSEIL